jgi:hypothetical protein
MSLNEYPEGVKKSSISSRDSYESVDISRYGQMIVGNRHDDILCRFEYNNSNRDIATTVTGTGAASNSGSMAVASTGAGIGSCEFNSVRFLAYRPAHEIYAFGSVLFTAGAADTSQKWGIYDTNDGLFFGYSGITFGLTIRKSTSDTFVAKSSWNRDKCDGTGSSGFNIDPTKNNQYKISYGWLGISPITFSVYGGASRGWIVCHVIDNSNVATTVTIDSPNFNIRWSSSRTVGAGAITVSVGSVSGGSTEGVHTHAGHRVFAGRVAAAIAAGTTHLATFHNKATFAGKTNKIRAEATFAGFSTECTKPVEFLFYRNATLAGMVYADIDTNNSVYEYSTAGTATGGTFELSIPLAKVDGQNIDMGAGHIHLEMFPNETMSILALSTGAGDVVATFRWEEYFS